MLLASVALVGCGNGGGQSVIGLSPTTAQVLDAGQTLTLSASVVNDPHSQGATYSVTGAGAVSATALTRLADASIVTATYSAPTTVTAQSTATVTATSVNTPSQNASVTITLNPALAITTSTLPSGTVKTAYSSTFASTGGSGGLTWAITSGTLPAGLTLNASGVLSGTPTAFGTFPFTISVTDAATTPNTVTANFTLNIIPQLPTITTTALPNGISGTPYSQQIGFAGGNGTTPTFTASGALPGGLTLSTSGLVSGTPTNAAAGASYSFNVTVSVGTQTSAPVAYTIIIPPLPTVTTTSLPNGNIGAAYSRQLNYNGGAGGTVSWAITSGSLPAISGLTLSTSGLISGTPTTATTYSFSVAVTVGTQISAPQALTLLINSLVITSPSNTTGELALPFSYQLTAAGGKPPYIWALASGSSALPPGLSLSTSGLITGTPTTITGSPFTNVIVQATDTVGGTATLPMTFTVNPARSSAGNSGLIGQYAFLLSGFDLNGKPLASAGEFSADGHGNITSGLIDANGTGLPAATSNLALSATGYSVSADGRGKLTLTTTAGSSTFVLALAPFTSGVATAGYLTEFDSSGNSLTGVISLQTPSAFSTAAITGGFAFGASGFSANSTATAQIHRAAAGEIQFNGVGSISSAEYVESSSNAGGPLNPKTLTINIGTNGRGTMALTPPAGSTQNFVVYVVSSGRFFLLSSDPASGTSGFNDLLYGQALQQTTAFGSFGTSSLAGATIARTESLVPLVAGGTYPDARIGILTFNAGAIQFSEDENAGGAAKTVTATASYAVSANGRVTVNTNSGTGGCADCVGGGLTYYYLVGKNQGFIADFTTAATSGQFEPQSSSLTNASFNGVYAAGSVLPLSQNSPYIAASLTANGTGTLSGTLDQAAAANLIPDVTTSGTYTAASTGRTVVTGIGSGNVVMYLISPTRAVLLDLGVAAPTIYEVVHQ